MKCCKHCGKEIKKTNTFCDSSCAAKYNNTHKHWRKSRNATCLNCGVEMNLKERQYCSVKCRADHKWKNVTIPRIIKGECGLDLSRRYIIELRGEKCEECGQLPIWNGKHLTLHLDHVDGNSDNNLLENLRILCPHCHTQTSTYGSKGKGNRYKKVTKRNKYLREYKQSVNSEAECNSYKVEVEIS